MRFHTLAGVALIAYLAISAEPAAAFSRLGAFLVLAGAHLHGLGGARLGGLLGLGGARSGFRGLGTDVLGGISVCACSAIFES